MKKILLLFLFIGCVHLVSGQTYLISTYNGQTVSSCSGKVYDAGGSSGGYGNGQNFSMTVCSNSGMNTHIKLYFWQFDIHPSDTLIIYDGNSTAAPVIGKYNNNNTLFLFPVTASASNATGCLTVQFKSDAATTGSGFEAEISCMIACQTVVSALDSVMMQYGDSNYVDICLGDTITFVGTGLYPQNNVIYPQSNTTSKFYWDFGDGTGIDSSGPVVSHYYPQMRGYNVELRIKDAHGCISMNALGTRVRISDSPIGHVGSLPDICSGSELSVSVGYSSLNNINVTIPQFYQSASLKYDSATFIPDGGAFGGQCYNTFVTFNVFNTGQTVQAATDIESVAVNMEHSFIGDLEFLLICPNGQSTVLKTYIQSGGAYMGVPFGGANHANFDCTNPPACALDPAQNPPGSGWTYSWTMLNPIYLNMNNYANGTQMDSGSYLPDNGFNAMIGCPLNGTWNLQVCDYWGIDNGWVFWWQLNLNSTILPVNWGYSVGIDTISWTGPNIISQNSSSMTIKPGSGGVYNYNVFIKDEFGCVYDTIVPINVVQSPIVDLGPDTSLCEGTPLQLTAPTFPNGHYYWLPSGDTAQSIPANESGEYIVITQTGNGVVQCLGGDTINVAYAPAPLISFMPDKFEGCDPVPIQFNNITQPSNAEFLWIFGDGDSSTLYSPSHIYDSTGSFNVTLQVSTGAGCEDSYTINNLIKIHPQPVASFILSDSIIRIGNPTVTFTNTSSDGTYYSWDFGDGSAATDENPSHTYEKTGFYDVWLTVSTDYNCFDSINKLVSVIDDELEIPNVITPNGDGKNDRFEIKNLSGYITNQLLIYDRWGRKIYDQVNYQNNWDGDNLPDGTYFFTIRAKGYLQNIEYNGTLTILGRGN